MGAAVIPPSLLALLLPVAAAAFGVFALIVVGERLLHRRREQRASRLQRALAEPSATEHAARAARRVERLTSAQLRQFDLAGMPDPARAALARAEPMRHSAEQLRRCVAGGEPCGTWQRVASLYVLAALGLPEDDRFHTLDVALRAGEEHLAAAAMRILLRDDSPGAAALLIAALLDIAPLRARIAATIDAMTCDWAPLLGPAFRHPDAAVRAWGARLAGRAVATHWADEVRLLTGDRNGVVRRVAVETLGRLGSPRDRDLLLARLADRVPMVRAHGARAVAAVGARDVASALAVLLADRAWMVRAAARDALRRLGPDARGALERTLFHQDGFAASSAAEALFGSGSIVLTARDALAHPADRARAMILARYFDAGGPLFQNALLEQFAPHEATRLLDAAAAWREPGRRQVA